MQSEVVAASHVGAVDLIPHSLRLEDTLLCKYVDTRELSVASALRAYYLMNLIRDLEVRSAAVYKEPCPELHIRGFCHLCVGQEAVYAGLHLAKREEDWVVTGYRAHGALLACAPHKAPELMAELAGKVSGVSGGRGGSMHVFDPESGFYGGHGIVGASTALGSGMALAKKYKGERGVAITMLGDGATNQGQFFESMNMASLWELPVLYVIENNGYAMGTSVERSTAVTALHTRGSAHGINGLLVDGMDALACYVSLRSAINMVECTQRPFILEVSTYRYVGHSMSDPGRYRSRDEVDRYRNDNDAINNLRSVLLSHGVAEKVLDEQRDSARVEVADALQFARQSDYPNVDDVESGIADV